MRFNAKQDIEAPLEFVQQSLSDFEAWERAAIRRGVDVSRTDKLRQSGPGMSWLSHFSYRGKQRTVTIELTGLDPVGHLAFSGSSASVGAEVAIDLLEMAARRTRLQILMEVKPKTLGARLFLQSLRLARARVDKSFDLRIAQLAADIEAKYRTSRRA